MPLLDVNWEHGPRNLVSFLFQWSSCASDLLNTQFPDGPPDAGPRFAAEVDCRTRLETTEAVRSFETGPPGAPFSAPARFTDRVGVRVIDLLGGREPAAAVLFACPDHKADSDGALAFAVRAAELMGAGIGVVVVDITPGPPSWATHLHSLTGVYPAARRPRGGECPVLVVHPRVPNGTERFDVWHHAVRLGDHLPTVPLPVRGAMHLRLDLESTYAEACGRSRIP